MEISSWDDVSDFTKKEEDYVEAICVNHTMAEKKILRSLGRGL